ncbi:MAG: hypothetical protein NTX53_03070 [candidate division WOR-3 bacterium]|nr:hypothetical protein [candidate division WOR-3 bacterium]
MGRGVVPYPPLNTGYRVLPASSLGVNGLPATKSDLLPSTKPGRIRSIPNFPFTRIQQ